ncbi:MAG TPA: glycosyltransferase [Candidatus Limnocylindria bacterium]|nr:glycosyltransferase [Candidatus Limnocylindria bacterium]
MLEAFRMVHWRHPSARFFLTDSVHDSMRPIMKTFSDLPIDWSPPLPHAQLAERLRSADIFVLPSLEEGLMRTALEAMSCGLPVVLTPHTGANDFVSSEEMGQVVPIRDAPAVAEAILKLADNVMVRNAPPQRHFNPEVLSFERFEENFLQCLQRIGI